MNSILLWFSLEAEVVATLGFELAHAEYLEHSALMQHHTPVSYRLIDVMRHNDDGPPRFQSVQDVPEL